jgi:hypothetical protein
VERHLVAIREKLVAMRELRRQIKEHQRRLLECAANVYSEQSEPLDGITATYSEVMLGDGPCTDSPIETHVLAHPRGEVMSIPGQKHWIAWREKRQPDDAVHPPDHASMRTDACLFCGKIVDPADSDPV